MIQLGKMAPHVVRDITEFMVENRRFRVDTVEQARAAMDQYSVHELFDMYLCWNGIIGYTDSILCALDGIRAAKDPV